MSQWHSWDWHPSEVLGNYSEREIEEMGEQHVQSTDVACVDSIHSDDGSGLSGPRPNGAALAAVEPKPETMEQFAERIRAECHPSGQVDQCQQLSAAVRRLAKRGVDPDYTTEAAQFDSLLAEAMQQLNEITRLLTSVRERVDLRKIKEERERRAAFWAVRSGVVEGKARRIPTGVSAASMKAQFMRALKQLTNEQRAALIERLKA